MKCPHCLDNFHEQQTAQGWIPIRVDVSADHLAALSYLCPSCGNFTVKLRVIVKVMGREAEVREFTVHPKVTARAVLPAEVVDPYRSEYAQACKVLADSPMASAALSRRCLQTLLREKMSIKEANLSAEIDVLISSNRIPGDLASAVDAIRQVGNFAAHPIKSTNTGEIIEVEEGEAELLLDVLEELFDHAFVRPARLSTKLGPIRNKLKEAGKPKLKESPS